MAKLSKSDFTIRPYGCEHVFVTYKDEKGKKHTNDMRKPQLIKRVTNADIPSDADLQELKRICTL